jgi:hypothetical protein
MAIPKDKDELQKAIIDNYKKLKTELLSIPTDLTTTKELEGHSKNTLMSIDNLVAYLVGWGQLVLKWNDKKEKGLHVDFPETGFKWNELGQLAQKFYKDYEKDNFKTLNEKLDKTTNEILKLIESKTNVELYELAWYDKWTFGKMIQLNTSSPFKFVKGPFYVMPPIKRRQLKQDCSSQLTAVWCKRGLISYDSFSMNFVRRKSL